MRVMRIVGRSAQPLGSTPRFFGDFRFHTQISKVCLNGFSKPLSAGPQFGNRYVCTNALSSQTTSYLRNNENGAEIFLVGTAHVSKESAAEVRDVIGRVKPNAVMVELCPGRAARLRSQQPTNDLDIFRKLLTSIFKPGSNVSAELLKFSFQGFYGVLRNLGLEVGIEFKAALEAAEKQNARIVYGDRNVQETLSRLASTVKFEDMVKMMAGKGPAVPKSLLDALDFAMSDRTKNNNKENIESHVEAMKTRAMANQMTAYLRQINPALAAVLIDERDEIMVQSLRNLKGRVVGVVGLAHLDGIECRWNMLQGTGRSQNERDCAELFTRR